MRICLEDGFEHAIKAALSQFGKGRARDDQSLDGPWPVKCDLETFVAEQKGAHGQTEIRSEENERPDLLLCDDDDIELHTFRLGGI